MKLLNENHSPFVKLLMTVAILMICFSFAAFLLSGLQFAFPDLQSSREGGLIAQAVSSFCVFGLAVGLYALLFERNFWSVLSRPKAKADYLWAVLLPLIALPAIDFLNIWNMKWEFAGDEIWRQMQQTTSLETQRLLSANSFGGLIGTIFVMAVMPAVLEELFFRGILQRLCFNLFKSHIAAIILTSVIFSLVHMEIFSFVPRFVLSLVLGTLFFSSGSLWIGILCHFVNNLISCIFFFLAHNGYISCADSAAFSQDWWLIAPSAILIVAFLALKWGKRKSETAV